MKTGVTAAIAVVIVIVVVVAALFATGILSFKGSGSGTNNSGTSTSTPGASNVVGTSQVNNAIGGTWSSSTGSTGTVSSSSGLQSVINLTTGGTAAKAGLNGAALGNPAIHWIATSGYPSTGAVSGPSGDVASVVGFEAGIFSPSSSSSFSFAAVGFLQYSDSSTPSSIFAQVYANVTNVSAVSTGTYMTTHKGVYSGHEFIYESTYSPTSIFYNGASTTYNYSHSLNTSALVGYSGQFIIFIFGESQTNSTFTMQSFETLYGSELTAVGSISASLGTTFVSSSTLGTDTGTTWTQDMVAGVHITDAKGIINSYIQYSQSGTSGASNIPSTDRALINGTVGSLTDVGASLYTSPSTGTINEIASIGYFQFNSATAVSNITTLLEAAGASSGFSTSTYNGYTYFNASSTMSTPNGTFYTSLVLFIDGSNIIYGFFHGFQDIALSMQLSIMSSEAAIA